MRERAGTYGRRALLAAAGALLMTSAPLAVAQQPPAGNQPPLPGGQPPAGAPQVPGGPPPVAEAADLQIDLDEDHRGSELEEGRIAVFEAHVVNGGPAVARDVRVVVSTPEEFDLDEVNHEAECQKNPGEEGRMVCRYGDLAPGAELRLKFRGEFREDGRSRTHVFVQGAGLDPDPGSNHASERLKVEQKERDDGDGGGSAHDRVTGRFTLRDPDESPPSVGGSFRIDARSGPNGESPRGTYSVRGTFGGTTTFDAEVKCLLVSGNVALVGTQVTRSESSPNPREGDTVLFRFEDNGEPGSDRDRFVGQNLGTTVPAEESCAVDLQDGDTIEEGNIDVLDR